MEVEDELGTASASVQTRITDARLWLLENLVAVMKLTSGQTCPKDGKVEEVPTSTEEAAADSADSKSWVPSLFRKKKRQGPLLCRYAVMPLCRDAVMP